MRTTSATFTAKFKHRTLPRRRPTHTQLFTLSILDGWYNGWGMLYLAIKAALSGIIIAAVSEIAKRSPGFGAFVASLPLISVLGMVWLWRDKPDIDNMASHVEATFWFVLPSLPMFLLMPWLMRIGLGFWPSLALGCALTIALYLCMTGLGPRLGLKL